MADQSSSDRTKSQIEADLGATRDRLAAAVETLIDQVHPNRIKQRQVSKFRQLADNARENAKFLIFNARGDLRTDRIGVLVGAAAGLTSFVLIIRAIARRGRKS